MFGIFLKRLADANRSEHAMCVSEWMFTRKGVRQYEMPATVDMTQWTDIKKIAIFFQTFRDMCVCGYACVCELWIHIWTGGENPYSPRITLPNFGLIYIVRLSGDKVMLNIRFFFFIFFCFFFSHLQPFHFSTSLMLFIDEIDMQPTSIHVRTLAVAYTLARTT